MEIFFKYNFKRNTNYINEQLIHMKLKRGGGGVE